MKASSRTDALIQLAIAEAPGVFALLKHAFAKAHPDAVAPSSDEVIQAYDAAFASSVAKDARWLAAHPGTSI